MKGNEDTPLRWVVLRMDTTCYWEFTAQNPPEGPRPARMWTVYLTSLDLGVHICSLTPSAELWFVENYPEWDDDVDDAVREAWYEWALTAEDEQVTYMDMSSVRCMVPDLAALHKDATWDGTPRHGKNWRYVETAPSAQVDALLEYVRGNSLV